MTDKNEEEESAPPRTYLKPETIAATSAIIATLATVISLGVSWFQWLELKRTNELSARQTNLSEQSLQMTKKSIAHSNDIARHQLRAYLILDRTFSEENPKSEEIPKFVIFRATNVGTTPARSAEFFGEVFFAEKPFKKLALNSLNSKKPDGIGLTIGANKEITFPADFDEINFNQNFSKYRSGSHVLVTAGKLVYKDIFGNVYTSEYCTYREYLTRNRSIVCPLGNNSE